MKVVGLGLSVVLVSLGAPFWFDVLCTVTRIRVTGKKPGDDGRRQGGREDGQ